LIFRTLQRHGKIKLLLATDSGNKPKDTVGRSAEHANTSEGGEGGRVGITLSYEWVQVQSNKDAMKLELLLRKAHAYLWRKLFEISP